jgi:hypothetical protein
MNTDISYPLNSLRSQLIIQDIMKEVNQALSLFKGRLITLAEVSIALNLNYMDLLMEVNNIFQAKINSLLELAEAHLPFLERQETHAQELKAFKTTIPSEIDHILKLVTIQLKNGSNPEHLATDDPAKNMHEPVQIALNG